MDLAHARCSIRSRSPISTSSGAARSERSVTRCGTWVSFCMPLSCRIPPPASSVQRCCPISSRTRVATSGRALTPAKMSGGQRIHRSVRCHRRHVRVHPGEVGVAVDHAVSVRHAGQGRCGQRPRTERRSIPRRHSPGDDGAERQRHHVTHTGGSRPGNQQIGQRRQVLVVTQRARPAVPRQIDADVPPAGQRRPQRLPGLGAHRVAVEIQHGRPGAPFDDGQAVPVRHGAISLPALRSSPVRRRQRRTIGSRRSIDRRPCSRE